MIYQIAAKAIMVKENGKEEEVSIVRRVRGKTEEEACALLSLSYRIKEVLGCFKFSMDYQPVDNGINYANIDDNRFIINI